MIGGESTSPFYELIVLMYSYRVLKKNLFPQGLLPISVGTVLFPIGEPIFYLRSIIVRWSTFQKRNPPVFGWHYLRRYFSQIMYRIAVPVTFNLAAALPARGGGGEGAVTEKCALTLWHWRKLCHIPLDCNTVRSINRRGLLSSTLPLRFYYYNTFAVWRTVYHKMWILICCTLAESYCLYS